jgi:hypothetical protein
MVLWRHDVGSRRKAVVFDIFQPETRYGRLGSCRGRLRQAYYKHKVEAEGPRSARAGFQMLIGHATSSCVDGGAPLKRVEVAHGNGITQMQDRKRLTWFLNTATNCFAANTWSVPHGICEVAGDKGSSGFKG